MTGTSLADPQLAGALAGDRRSCYWPRAILHVDMNAFFASVEQRDFPELRGRPVVITNGESGTTIITASYEARAAGIRTGMRLHEARQRCPHVVRRVSRPAVYAATSKRIMRALVDLSPDVEVFSVDEAFVDVTHCQRLHGTPEHMAMLARRLVQQASDGLSCSIGVAGSRLTAKIASDLRKPDGITVIPPWEARERLEDVPMEKLCGIGPAVAEFLRMHGARTLGDVTRLPVELLERRYGVTGRALWLAAQGRDPDPVTGAADEQKSISHGKVLPPRTASRRALDTYLRYLCEKVAARLRRGDLFAERVHVTLRIIDGNVLASTSALKTGLADGRQLYACAQALLDEQRRGQAVTHVNVTASGLKHSAGQLELFGESTVDDQRARAVDRINAKFGQRAVGPAVLLGLAAGEVIPPAWRPAGVRQTISGR